MEHFLSAILAVGILAFIIGVILYICIERNSAEPIFADDLCYGGSVVLIIYGLVKGVEKIGGILGIF